MKFRRTAAAFNIVVGTAMIGVWAMLLATGQDPQLQVELRTIPFAIGMAIFSDLLTAVLLITAGIGLAKNSRWAVKAFLLAGGFLFYSVINAAGLYGQRGDAAFTFMFAVIFVLAILFTVFAFNEPSEDPRKM